MSRVPEAQDETKAMLESFFACVSTGKWPEAYRIAATGLTNLHEHAEYHGMLNADRANHLGVAFSQNGDYDRTLIWYRKAWDFLPADGESQLRGILLANLAEIGCLRGDGSQVDALLDQAEGELAKVGPIQSQFASGSQELRAIAAKLRGDQNLAEKYFLASITIARNANLKGQEHSVLVQLAALYDGMGNREMAQSIRDTLLH